MGRALDDVFDGMWEIFDDAGFFDTATILPEAGKPFDIQVDFRDGSADVFEGIAQSAQFSFTYRVADADLRRGSLLCIDGVNYRVKLDPESDATGLNAIASLEKKT